MLISARKELSQVRAWWIFSSYFSYYIVFHGFSMCLTWFFSWFFYVLNIVFHGFPVCLTLIHCLDILALLISHCLGFHLKLPCMNWFNLLLHPTCFEPIDWSWDETTWVLYLSWLLFSSIFFFLSSLSLFVVAQRDALFLRNCFINTLHEVRFMKRDTI